LSRQPARHPPITHGPKRPAVPASLSREVPCKGHSKIDVGLAERLYRIRWFQDPAGTRPRPKDFFGRVSAHPPGMGGTEARLRGTGFRSGPPWPEKGHERASADRPWGSCRSITRMRAFPGSGRVAVRRMKAAGIAPAASTISVRRRRIDGANRSADGLLDRRSLVQRRVTQDRYLSETK
jgi:hypothetical protein